MTNYWNQKKINNGADIVFDRGLKIINSHGNDNARYAGHLNINDNKIVKFPTKVRLQMAA